MKIVIFIMKDQSIIFFMIFLINISYLSNSEKVSNADVVTEIITEGDADVVENETSTMYGNFSVIENVTELNINDEEITEMLNASMTTVEPPTTNKPADKDPKRRKKSHKTSTKSDCHCDLVV